MVYTVAALIPDLRRDPRGRAAARQVLHRIDPERQRRHIQQRLEMADTAENRRALAEESMRLGDFANAAEIYRSVLKGVYADDAAFLLGLARAQAGLDDFGAARETLDRLFAAHPAFRSSDAELLRARLLAAVGDHAAAFERYRESSTSYPGEEARFRCAALLKQSGRFAEARGVFGDMLKRAKNSPRYYRKTEKGWLDAAQRELASLGPG
ncbi:MAG: tetratricopeptide repeat protein [Rudaea sp.]